MCRDLILAGLLACLLLYLCIPLRQPQAPHNAAYLVYSTEGSVVGYMDAAGHYHPLGFWPHEVSTMRPVQPEVIVRIYPQNLTGQHWKAYRVEFNKRMARRLRAGQATRGASKNKVKTYYY